jgi:hypothetical protein
VVGVAAVLLQVGRGVLAVAAVVTLVAHIAEALAIHHQHHLLRVIAEEQVVRQETLYLAVAVAAARLL